MTPKFHWHFFFKYCPSLGAQLLVHQSFKGFVITQELSQNLGNTFQVAIAKGHTQTRVLFAL
jgi:hypothetical protein